MEATWVEVKKEHLERAVNESRAKRMDGKFERMRFELTWSSKRVSRLELILG